MSKINTDLISHSTTCAGWVMLGIGYFSVTDIAAIIGAFATIAGFLMTWYYKHKAYKLEKAEIELKNGQKIKE